MTLKHTTPMSSGPATQFPERPPRRDMQNVLYLYRPSHQTALIRHFGRPDTTLVISEMPIGWNVSQRQGLLYPDLLIAFDIDCDSAIADRGFSIERWGKPPDFVLEVASRTTSARDYDEYEGKRGGYARYGVPEYWRFDNTGGEFYPEPLAGDRLVEGQYQPMSIFQTDESRYWGHSEVLNLDLCWERGQLRWWDPASPSYLLTHDDEADARLAAESRADAERQARLAAQTQRDAAQAESAQAQARIRQLEEELRRRSQ